jgi:GST-like protein
MDGYTLFGFKGAGSAAVELALEAAELPYRVVSAASWEPSSALDRLRAVNPLLQIPTLVLPDGGVMTESAAILLHLGLDAAPPGRLLPADAAARAQAIRGLVYIAANCYSAIGMIDYPQRWTGIADEAGQEAVKQGVRRQLHRHWEIFADTFPAKPFFSGEQPGALDFLAVVVSKWSGTRAHLAQHRPAMSEALRRIETHGVVVPVFRRHWDA